MTGATMGFGVGIGPQSKPNQLQLLGRSLMFWGQPSLTQLATSERWALVSEYPERGGGIEPFATLEPMEAQFACACEYTPQSGRRALP